MLTIEARIVLSKIIFLKKANVLQPSTLEIVDKYPKFVQDKIESKIDSILKYLEDKSYITFVDDDNIFTSVQLTYEGLHYFEIDILRTLDVFFHSILCPIIVAFVTAILTLKLN